MDGTDEEILADPELMELLLPAIRADFALVENYAYRPGHPLPCPVTVLGGTADPDVKASELGRWAQLTTGETRVRVFPGGHFFLQDHRSEVTGLIAAALGVSTHP